MKNIVNPNTFKLLLLFIVPIVMIATGLWLTRYGGGITPDSFSYVAAARSMKNGDGVMFNNVEGGHEPLTHFPPGVSILLAVLPSDPAGSLRILNAFLLGLLLFLAGTTVFITTRSLTGALFSQLFIASLIDIVNAHIFLWSEPLFLTVLVSILLCLALYKRSEKSRFLTLAVIAAAMLPIIRYVGIVIIPFMVIAVWLLLSAHSNLDKKQKLFTIGKYLFIMIAPIELWQLAVNLLNNERAIRSFGIHLITQERMSEGITTVLHWFIHPDVAKLITVHPYPVVIISVLLLAVFLFIQRKKIIPLVKNASYFLFPFLFIAGYLSFLVISISFFDAYTPLDGRILSPVAVMFGLLVGLLVASVQKHTIAFGTTGFIAIMVIGIQLSSLCGFIQDISREGLPFASESWQRSETLSYIVGMPENITIYTNLPHPVAVLSGKDEILMFPRKYTLSGASVLRYDREIQEVVQAKGEKYIVFFKGNHSGVWRYPSIAELETLLEVEQIVEMSDGVVFRVK
ncbi:MAG: hypothetical protein QY314_02530 [Candidatus Dojkabacteria bacterium]|nr:MAG: hypothetical protein QY314_02530 [Candidatus Dojkabacteria bacterium]